MNDMVVVPSEQDDFVLFDPKSSSRTALPHSLTISKNFHLSVDLMELGLAASRA
jgi:hypothetical protein